MGYVPGYDGVDMSFGFPPYEDPPPPYALYKPEDMLPPHEPPPPYTEVNDGFEPDNANEGGGGGSGGGGGRGGRRNSTNAQKLVEVFFVCFSIFRCVLAYL